MHDARAVGWGVEGGGVASCREEGGGVVMKCTRQSQVFKMSEQCKLIA